METDKPRIAVLMAVYRPRMDWLRAQLESLNAQTWPRLRLYVRDDGSPPETLEAVRALLQACVTRFPWTLEQNEENLGSNRTFERLTAEAEGDCLAYCDQDDIWLPEKLSVLQEALAQSGAELVCSDMFIIDENGRQIADSITKIRRRHIFHSGTGLTDTLWYSNFASGCALLVRADTAKRALPFNPYMYYDHYLTLFCANAGRVVSLPQRLIRHREHGKNQSSVLQGVHDKASYRRIRIDQKAEEVCWLSEHFACDGALGQTLREGAAWMRARQAYARGDWKSLPLIWKYRRFSRLASALEIAAPLIPEPLFRLLLWAKRKNYV